MTDDAEGFSWPKSRRCPGCGHKYRVASFRDLNQYAKHLEGHLSDDDDDAETDGGVPLAGRPVIEPQKHYMSGGDGDGE